MSLSHHFEGLSHILFNTHLLSPDTTFPGLGTVQPRTNLVTKPLSAPFFPKDKIPGLELQVQVQAPLRLLKQLPNSLPERQLTPPSRRVKGLFSLNLVNAVLWANTWYFIVILINIFELVKLPIFSLSTVIYIFPL